MCTLLLPVWLVSLVRHSAARLQQKNFMQLQREGVDVCDSEEGLQVFLLLFRKLLLELRRQFLKRILQHDHELDVAFCLISGIKRVFKEKIILCFNWGEILGACRVRRHTFHRLQPRKIHSPWCGLGSVPGSQQGSRVTVLTRKQIVWSPWVEFCGSLMSAGEAAHCITSTPRTFLEF